MTKVFSSVLAISMLCMGFQVQSQSACSDFRTFYVNHGPGVSGSNLYAVDMIGSDAELSFLDNFSYEIHFAYGDVDNLLYLVNANGNSIDVYDVDLGVVTNTISLESGLSQLYAVVYNPNDGLLYVGSANQNKIFAIDLSDGSYTFVADAPIVGGDLVLKGDELYVFTRDNHQMRKVVGSTTELVGSIPVEVNGAALTSDGNFILANFGQNVFSVVDSDANVVETIEISLDNEVFTTSNGDLASGCRAFDPGTEPGECTAYSLYYMNISTVAGASTLYEVEIDGANANLTAVETFETSAHLGISEEGDLYIVIGSGKLVIYDPSTGTSSEPVQITLDGSPLSNIPHVVVDPNDGTVYIASANTNSVYTVDPITAEATLFLELDLDVVGGDLVFTEDGTLWLVNRFDNTFYNISAGGVAGFSVDLNNINGAALLDDGTIIVANSGSSAFNLIDPATGMVMEATLQTEIIFENGDLAAACTSREPVVQTCGNLVTYYYNYLGSGSNTKLFRVELSDGDANYTEIAGFGKNTGNHIALSEDGLIYSVRSNQIDIFDPITATYIQENIPVKSVTGASLSGFPAAVIDANGTLWLARSTNNTVYSIEFIGGEAIATAQFDQADGIMVDGGDLVITEAEEGGEILWLANRSNNLLYNLTNGGSLTMPVTEVNGVSALADNTLLLANGQLNANGGLYKWNPLTEELTQLANNDGPAQFENGDLASRCLSAGPGVGIPETGECNAAEVIEYVEGFQKNGNFLNGSRTDAQKATGEPQRSDAMVFVTLGYGGSITLGFNGAVHNLEGDDLEVVETSFGNPGCAAYPEYADVYVSVDGGEFHFASTVCKGNPFVDISDAGDFEYITQVKIVNRDEDTTTPDGYDLDGVVAIHNCEATGGNAPQPALAGLINAGRITSMPNPTQGNTQVVFSTEAESRTTVEIIDLSGRVVETLFNQTAIAGQEYRAEFNAAQLTNGVYIARMVTGSEVVITKIMVNH